MAILITDDYLGRIEAVPRYSGAAAGDLVGMDNAKINAVADPIKGIIVDAVPTENPPSMLKLAGVGCVIEDTVMDGVAAGNLVWSDGDGTYSIVAPTAGAAGTLRNILGVVRRIDTQGTDAGCEIELTLQVNTDAVT
jgi:hypothetical protein